ncbi:tetratricopeptide repeat protein [Blastopirellula retiformator]|uniref:Tetratricopeptide repeat protein n=1 Tax=Blastopirellula retiformator TaxID=2527970 RepID=A0A5C5V2R5_9BACT|nr:tetratricopeptide repeat protein [Blastopirellula retiformator]TWT32022.1 Tetratricopeptide repeat protein [Blastopirellula retiformator]
MDGQNATADSAAYEITPAKRKRLQSVFDHATGMMKQQKYDFDYAHSLLGECVKSDPANLIYAEKMMENLERKFKGKKPKGLFGAFGGRGIKKALASKNWAEVLGQGVDMLKSNAWDAAALVPMVDACAELRCHEVGLLFMKYATDGSPNDIEVRRHCARYLGSVGQFDQAMAVWHFINEKTRGDDEANKMISQLTLDKERIRQGLPTITNKIDVRPGEKPRPRPKSVQEEAKSEKPKVAIELNEKQILDRVILASPEKVENYLKLADLWQKDDKYHEAELVMKKAQAAIGQSLQIIQKFEDIRINRARHRYEVAEKQFEAGKTAESRKLADDLKDELNRTELEIYQTRAERHPDDKKHLYEYGLRLKRAGNLDEAIEVFDQVIEGDEKMLAIANLGKGECLQAKKKYHTAMECFEEALSYSEHLSSERHKQLLYRSGVLAMGLGEHSDAKAYFKRLKKMDPGYRDIDSRLDKVRKMLQDK